MGADLICITASNAARGVYKDSLLFLGMMRKKNLERTRLVELFDLCFLARNTNTDFPTRTRLD